MKRKEREVLSYEDKPIEDPNSDEKFSLKFLSGKGKSITIILVICIVVVAVVAGWNFISPNNVLNLFSQGEQGAGYPAELEGSSVQNGNIASVNGNFMYVSDTSYVVLNETAGVVQNRSIKYAAPVMFSKGNYTLIYNQDDSGFEVNEIDAQRYVGDIDAKIITGDINSIGEYALVTQHDGYAAKLTVFDVENNQKFAYYFSEYYINSVSLGEDGKTAVVAGCSTIDGVLVSSVYVLNFTSEEPVAIVEFPDNLVYQVDILNNGNIAVVGDRAAAIIDSKYETKNDYNYNDSTLTSVVIDPYNGIALSLSPSGDGRNCIIRYISSSSTTDVEIPTELQITSMAHYGNSILVLSKGELIKYNHNGEKIGEWQVGTDANAIKLASENKAYILCVSEIRTQELR